jgi:hypothetical protein
MKVNVAAEAHLLGESRRGLHPRQYEVPVVIPRRTSWMGRRRGDGGERGDGRMGDRPHRYQSNLLGILSNDIDRRSTGNMGK